MNFCRIFLFAYKLATLNCLLTNLYMLSNILSLAVYGGFALRAVGRLGGGFGSWRLRAVLRLQEVADGLGSWRLGQVIGWGEKLAEVRALGWFSG